MTYIENIFICLVVPLMLTLFFTSGNVRRFITFIIVGMGVCLLSAYITGFAMSRYGTSQTIVAIEIAPVVEEVMKLLPILFYLLVLEPHPRRLPIAAISVAVGFATLENVCYLTENGAANFYYLLIRGMSAGALHILCGIICGFGISYVFRHSWLKLTGTVGILGFCSGFHAIYNLLITADGAWKAAGCVFPSLLIVCLFFARKLLPHFLIMLKK